MQKGIFKSVRARMMVTLLPLTVIAMLLLSLFSFQYSKSLISDEIAGKMNNQLNATVNDIMISMKSHSSMTETIARTIEATDGAMTKEQFVSLVSKPISINPDTFGLGVWFEPNTYKKDVKFFAPYAYRDQDKITYTDDYNTEDYNYPSKPWYEAGKSANQTMVWSPPFYDEILKATLVTAIAPFYDKNNKFQGIATGDISLDFLQRMIQKIKIGETGYAFLVDRQGQYLADHDASKVMKVKITEDPNQELAANGDAIVKNKEGTAEFHENGVLQHVYYKTVPETDWTLCLVISDNELYASMSTLIKNLIPIILVATLADYCCRVSLQPLYQQPHSQNQRTLPGIVPRRFHPDLACSKPR